MSAIIISKLAASAQPQAKQDIEESLLSALAQVNAQSENATLVFSADSKDGRRLGGATGSTSYGWLLLKMLWVDDSARGAGLGRQLTNAIEAEAKRLGCHSAWLDTSNRDAREFYLKLGYSDFGKLENGPDRTPPEHIRWFMKKTL